MALVVAAKGPRTQGVLYVNGSSDNAGEVMVQSDNVLAYNTFMISHTAGAVSVYGSIDGTNYATSPISLADLGGTTTNPVTVTVANRLYGFRGSYMNVRIEQIGATGVTAAALLCTEQ